MSRRAQIQMSVEQVAEFLEQQRIVVCATNGADGWPHLMPLWYVVRDGGLWAWTYAASQKVQNLERDPRATLQIETGTEYNELRGVMFKCETRVHRAVEIVAPTGLEIFTRYAGGVELPAEARAMVEKQAQKRVALEFVEQGRASWDHRKLGGVY
ncbi:MAG: pyridoxamine 5'-phosphate oxidase family protein [Solirubrobacteraceae bacterium]